jgi:translation initiation factor IF-3
VKVTCSFFGREMSHQELGRALIDKMVRDIGDMGKMEMPSKMEGRNLSIIIGPSPKALKELHAHEAAVEAMHRKEKQDKEHKHDKHAEEAPDVEDDIEDDDEDLDHDDADAGGEENQDEAEQSE